MILSYLSKQHQWITQEEIRLNLYFRYQVIHRYQMISEQSEIVEIGHPMYQRIILGYLIGNGRYLYVCQNTLETKHNALGGSRTSRRELYHAHSIAFWLCCLQAIIIQQFRLSDDIVK